MTETADQWELREKIIEHCIWMNDSGLNQGTSGNISIRYQDTMLITPSGIPYEKLKPVDIAQMSLLNDLHEWDGPHKPSSEWHFHRAILQSDSSYQAVIHTHSMYATTLSIGRVEIPACHYMIAAFGGNTVRCADYATFGTPELSAGILRAMENRSACLMANHGMVVAGSSLEKAMWAAVELETLSKQYYLARTLGRMVVLPDDEIDFVVEKFADYGPQEKSAAAQDSTEAGDDNTQSQGQSQGQSRSAPSRRVPQIALPAKKL